MEFTGVTGTSSSNSQQTTNLPLSKESKDTLQLLKKLNVNSLFSSDQTLTNRLKVIDPSELSLVLKQFFVEAAKEESIGDPVEFLDKLAKVIPFEKLEKAVKDDIDDALKEAKEMISEAKTYLELTKGKTAPSIQARLTAIFDGIISLLECIFRAFGIADLFKPAESDLHADVKSNKIMSLFYLFNMLTHFVGPAAVTETGENIIGLFILCFAALSIIWPFIKPMPTYLPSNAKNLTKLARQGKTKGQGKQESLDQIASIMKINRHAILVGPSRVGKSRTARAFAESVERGDYPELVGKVVFLINTTDIIGKQSSSFLGGGNNSLNEISDAMGRHRDDIILVFDEIHMACKNNEKISDQLKTFLDEDGEFPHVIGITTDEEYESHVKNNNAFSLRFDKVEIKNTNKDETIKILGDTILRSNLRPLIQEDTLDLIYSKSCEIENAPQPASADRLLKQCINKTGKTQKSTTEQKIIEVSNKISSIRTVLAATRSAKKKEFRSKIAELEIKLNDLQKIKAEEKAAIEKLFKSKDLLDLVTKQTYCTVLKVSQTASKTLNSSDEKQLKLFLLLHKFLAPSLRTHIEETAKTLQIKLVIDKELIQEA